MRWAAGRFNRRASGGAETQSLTQPRAGCGTGKQAGPPGNSNAIALAPRNSPLAFPRQKRHGAAVPATRRGRERSTCLAAEGATGPRKRSGNRDRGGIRDLWKAGARMHAAPHRRSKGPRRPESLRFRDRGGSATPASRRRVTRARSVTVIENALPDDPTPKPLKTTPLDALAPRARRADGAVRRLCHAGAVRLHRRLAARCRGGVLAEHLHCRAHAALFDVSHMGQATLTGADRRRRAGTPGARRHRRPQARTASATRCSPTRRAASSTT